MEFSEVGERDIKKVLVRLLLGCLLTCVEVTVPREPGTKVYVP